MTLQELIPPSIEAVGQQIADFLNIMIYQSDFIFINFWSLSHIFFGMLVILLLSTFQQGFRRFIWLFIIIGIWEGFEYVMYGIVKSELFRVEIWQDVASDFFFGIIGGIIMAILLLSIKLNKNSKQ